MPGDFNEIFNAACDRAEAAVPRALATAMEHVRGVVAAQTPVETGHLVGSEDVVSMPEEADILIPGPYARRQHFGLDFHHNTGNALFLELPMVSEAQTAIDIASNVVGEAL
jgi:hypothetical protein